MSSPSPYVLVNNDLVLDSERYVLRVRDLPIGDKPREKMRTRGPEPLSVPELLAIILSTGTVKEGVLEMSTRIAKEYGEKALLTRTDAELLAKDLDIPLGKALQIVACGELGRRFYRKNHAAAPVIRSAEDVFEYTVEMRTLPKEHLRGLYLNTHYQVIHDEILSIGTVDSNLIHPREVFKPALEYSAAAVVLVHNHPSGIVTPSEADISITQQLAEAGKLFGIDLVDHVIVTSEGFARVPVE